MDQVKMLQKENEALKAENAQLRSRTVAASPIHVELAKLILAEPRTVTELSSAMTRENRYVSQCIYQLKQRYGTKIVTLSDGRKEITDLGTLVLPE